jgi:hypothetical protein
LPLNFNRKNTAVEGEHKLLLLAKNIKMLQPYMQEVHGIQSLNTLTLVSSDTDTLLGAMKAVSVDRVACDQLFVHRLKESIEVFGLCTAIDEIIAGKLAEAGQSGM